MVELQDLQNLLTNPERATINETVLFNHSRDLTYHQPVSPDAVIFPVSADEVRKIMAYASQKSIAVTAYGAGSSLEGHTIPVHRGITLDFSEMNRIIEIRPDDFIARVEPGVTRQQLNHALKRHGLFFPVDPGADATLGGMAATNASGTSTVKYGAMRQNVLGLKAVLADGRLIHTGSMTFKTSAGYDLKDLFVGSEGTLGAITELTLKLTGIPETIKAGKAVFSSIEAAGEAALYILKAGIHPARIELVDRQTVVAVNLNSGTHYTEAPSLFLEFSGNETTVNEDIRFSKEMLEMAGCRSFEFAADEKERNQLWHARHEAGLAVVQLMPGKRKASTDVCVPISELTACLSEARRLVEQSRFKLAAIFGHVGDGNFHVAFGVDPNDEQEIKAYKDLNRRIVAFALERGGTCTGEHGVGLGKKEYALMEHGEAIDVMRAIKKALDPLNLLNPGKIF